MDDDRISSPFEGVGFHLLCTIGLYGSRVILVCFILAVMGSPERGCKSVFVAFVCTPGKRAPSFCSLGLWCFRRLSIRAYRSYTFMGPDQDLEGA